MSANFSQLAQIASSQEFQQRVSYAMTVAASNVYSEAGVTSAATPAGNAVLTFAATPGGAGAGAPVVDLTTSAAIPAGTTVLSTTPTTVTMSANAATGGVLKGDSIAFVANHSARAAFAIKVVQGNYSVQAACLAVLTNPTIAAEAVNGVAGNSIPDSDIQFAVNSLWNILAGI